MQKLVGSSCPFPVSPALLQMLNATLTRYPSSDSLILNYRDPGYSATTGGFHPVEIHIEDNAIQYITDFAYRGQGDFAELDKELDFDFAAGVFQQMGRCYPIADGRALFAAWQGNFCAYYEWGVFAVSTTVWGDA